MKYCNRCVMPDTKPGVRIDEKGVCSACRAVEAKKLINWEARHEELKQICEDIKRTNTSCYDAIVPVSGGKDSQYQVWMMKEVFKMNVLCVCFSNHLPTEEGIYNLNQMVEAYGVDLVKVNVKNSAYRKLRRKAFFQIGEPSWAEHCGVFSSVANVALIYNVPIIMWGEDIAVEFGGKTSKVRKADARDINRNDLIKGKNVIEWCDEDILESDVFFFKYPAMEEFEKRGIKSLYLGYYHNWDGKLHYEHVQKYGFQPRKKGPLKGNYLHYDNIDEKLCEICIWLKYIKFGFWRPTDQCCYQIWNGRMTRAEAVKIVNELSSQFPDEYFKDWLDYHMITENQFWEVVEKYRNKNIWEKIGGEWRLKYPLI